MIPIVLALMTLSGATDSAVLLPTPTPPATKTGPLEPSSFGLGFRALGEAPSIHVSYAISERKSIGLEATWFGSFMDSDNESTTSYQYQDYWYNTTQTIENKTYSNGEQTQLAFRLALPFEVVLGCKGDVCVTGSIGPMYELMSSESQVIDPTYDKSSVSYQHMEQTTHKVGLIGSIGVRWEFIPGLCLATSYGADAWRSFGENNSEYISSNSSLRRTAEETHQGFGTESWFGGIGLDAWF